MSKSKYNIAELFQSPAVRAHIRATLARGGYPSDWYDDCVSNLGLALAEGQARKFRKTHKSGSSIENFLARIAVAKTLGDKRDSRGKKWVEYNEETENVALDDEEIPRWRRVDISESQLETVLRFAKQKNSRQLARLIAWAQSPAGRRDYTSSYKYPQQRRIWKFISRHAERAEPAVQKLHDSFPQLVDDVLNQSSRVTRLQRRPARMTTQRSRQIIEQFDNLERDVGENLTYQPTMF